MHIVLNQIKKISSHTYMMVLILVIGICARGWLLGSVPGGINQDEAFAGYEAYSLLHYGVDSSGYAFPVYLNTWGSGMNALNTYLMIPFIAVFGLHSWVIRIPQFIVACFTLYITYKLLLKLFDQQMALLGLAFLVICPWHIMMSRWGLEANLAPGFLLFGFYFFVLAAEKPKYFIVSALFYGFSLYCYATIWPIVPLMIALQLIYLLYTGKLHFNRYTVTATFLLALLALPLMLFLLVNYGYMQEIVTPFMSIPKLTMMRKNDISFSNMGENLQRLVSVILNQGDGLIWNATEQFGLYYSKWFLVFGVIGFLYCCKRALISVLKRTYDGAVLLLIPFVCAVLLGCVIEVNVNRINCIHLPIIIFISIGLCQTMQLMMRLAKKYSKYIPILFACTGLFLFLRFERYYFSDYRQIIGSEFQEGLEDAVQYALMLSDGEQDIFVDFQIYYPKVLFYSRLPVTEYRNTVQYVNYPSEFLLVGVCGSFHFGYSGTVTEQIGIIPSSFAETFLAEGWEVQQFGWAAVITRP